MAGRSEFRSLLGNRNFMKLWLAQIVSAIGDRLAQMALLGLISGAVSQTLTQLVSLTLFAALPGLFVGPFAAMVLDRIDRKKVLIWADAFRGVMVLTIPFVYKLPPPFGVGMVHIIVFGTAVLASLHGLTHSVVLPQIVGRDNLLTANSMTTATGLISTLIGFALVGALVRHLSIETNFALNSLIYGGSAMLMALLVIKRVVPQSKLRVSQAIDDLKHGVRLAFTDKIIRPLILLSASFWAVAGFVYVAVFALAMRELHFDTKVDADLFGIMMSCLGMGLVTGALGISRLQRVAHFPQLPYLMLVPLGLSIALWADATARWPSIIDAVAAWPVASFIPRRILRALIPSLGLAWIGVMGAACLIPIDTSVQRQVPDHLLGRVQSARSFITGIGFCVAVALAGVLTQLYDASEIIVGFGIGVAVLAAVRIALSRVLRYQIMRGALKLLMCVVFRLKVEGLEKVPIDRPVLFALSQSGLMVGSTLFAVIPRRVYFLTSREFFKLRKWQEAVLRRLGFVSRDRGEGIRATVHQAAKILGRGKHLVVFPGRNAGSGRGGFVHENIGSMARVARVPVVPVVVCGWPTAFPGATGGGGLRRIRVLFGEPIMPGKFGRRQKEALSEELRNRMAALLGESVSSSGLAGAVVDCRRAGEKGLPGS